MEIGAHIKIGDVLNLIFQYPFSISSLHMVLPTLRKIIMIFYGPYKSPGGASKAQDIYQDSKTLAITLQIWYILFLSGWSDRALPDITSVPDFWQIFKIWNVQKPEDFFPGRQTFNTFKSRKTKNKNETFFQIFFTMFLELLTPNLLPKTLSNDY